MDTQAGIYSGDPKDHDLLAQRLASILGCAPDRCDYETRQWLFWLWMAGVTR